VKNLPSKHNLRNDNGKVMVAASATIELAEEEQVVVVLSLFRMHYINLLSLLNDLRVLPLSPDIHDQCDG